MLEEGIGTALSENAVLEPFTAPAGISASVNEGDAEPEPADPHGAEDPSTCTQSVTLPDMPSSKPEASITAIRPALYAGPSVGRTAKSASKPITLDSAMGALPGE